MSVSTMIGTGDIWRIWCRVCQPGAPGSRPSKMIRSGSRRPDGDTELPFPEIINTWKSLPEKA